MSLNWIFEGGESLLPSEATADFGANSLPQSYGGATIHNFPRSFQDQLEVEQETQQAVGNLLLKVSPNTTFVADYSSNIINMDERRREESETSARYVEPELGTIDRIRAMVDKLVAKEDTHALIEIAGVVHDACAALGVATQTDGILAQGSAPSSGMMPASTDVATSLGHNSGLPAWFLDLKAKLEDGTIPHYAGKWHDGDPVEFLLSHYKEVVNARILTQAHLKALDRKLYDSVKHTYRNSGRELTELLPVAVVFSKKFMN